MSGIVHVRWRIEPATPPQPRRHCSTCGGSRLFRSSGRIRLNANGRVLDAWLIYRCESCDRTWNLPLIERRPVAGIPPLLLAALQHSDPGWVRACEQDLGLLARHCDELALPPEVTVARIVDGDGPEDWSVIELALEAACATGLRLDRLLARELSLGRAELQAMQRAGGLVIVADSGRLLRRPIRGNLVLRFVACDLAPGQRAALARALLQA